MVESPKRQSQVAREGREGCREEESAVCSLAPSSERFPPWSLMPTLPAALAAPPDAPIRPGPTPPPPRFWLALALGPWDMQAADHSLVCRRAQAPLGPCEAARWREG